MTTYQDDSDLLSGIDEPLAGKKLFYIKEIVKGESYILLSSEEMDALRQAVHFGENKVQ